MAIEELLAVVSPPKNPLEKGGRKKWALVQKDLGTALPSDFYDFGVVYGSGGFEDGENHNDPNCHITVYVYNPFSPYFVDKWVKGYCNRMRRFMKVYGSLGGVFDLYPLFPEKPGLIPWGRDNNETDLFWLTEGKAEEWPIIVSDNPEYQRFDMCITTFLAKVFTRKLKCIAWQDPIFFSNSVMSFWPVNVGVGG